MAKLVKRACIGSMISHLNWINIASHWQHISRTQVFRLTLKKSSIFLSFSYPKALTTLKRNRKCWTVFWPKLARKLGQSNKSMTSMTLTSKICQNHMPCSKNMANLSESLCWSEAPITNSPAINPNLFQSCWKCNGVYLCKHNFFHYDLSKDMRSILVWDVFQTIDFLSGETLLLINDVLALTLRLHFLRDGIWTCPNEPLLIIDLWLFSFCNCWLWLFDCIGRSQAACMAEQRTATEIGSSTSQLRIGSETPFHHPITCTPTVRVRGPSKSIIKTDLRENAGIF